MIAFWVQSKPIPKQRPRVTRNGTYTPKATRDAESAIRAAWREAGAGQLPDGRRIKAYFYFALERPKAHYRTNGGLSTEGRRNAHPVCSGRKNADIDNYIKLVMDALNGCAYADDGAITEITAVKQWGSDPSVYVSLTALDDGETATR